MKTTIVSLLALALWYSFIFGLLVWGMLLTVAP